MPVGVITNVLSVFIGGIIGYLLRKRFSESLKASLNGAFGLAALVIGISLLDGMHSLSAVILALLVGGVRRGCAEIGGPGLSGNWNSDQEDSLVFRNG